MIHQVAYSENTKQDKNQTTKHSALRHIIIKLQKTKTKQKNLRKTRQGKKLTYLLWNNDKITVNFLEDTM